MSHSLYYFCWLYWKGSGSLVTKSAGFADGPPGWIRVLYFMSSVTFLWLCFRICKPGKRDNAYLMGLLMIMQIIMHLQLLVANTQQLSRSTSCYYFFLFLSSWTPISRFILCPRLSVPPQFLCLSIPLVQLNFCQYVLAFVCAVNIYILSCNYREVPSF